MAILLTGGAGYIGSHIAVELGSKGEEIVIVDDLSNSSFEAIRRIERLTGSRIHFFQSNLSSTDELAEICQELNVDSIIHLAAFKSVAESVTNPLAYYRNNLSTLLTVLEAIERTGLPKTLIFSSSATVYGTPQNLPIKESHQTGVGLQNPYASTKYIGEQILRDFSASRSDISIVSLRYFNPIGAHPSGLIGESPNQTPNNLMPIISEVATGARSEILVYGTDYQTSDGSGVRDYVHVVDVAKGHVAALEINAPGFKAINLGTGLGTSVFELIRIFEGVSNTKIPLQVSNRRPGDVASCFSDVDYASKILGWSSEATIEDACRDTWNWLKLNPNGYTAQE